MHLITRALIGVAVLACILSVGFLFTAYAILLGDLAITEKKERQHGSILLNIT
jgi:uncharacterized membrane protein